jgi:tetratricopeptide (TPR) repeat protein
MLTTPTGKKLHELRRRIDYVMGSGQVAATYFTEENGRLFQLPLTWYRNHGWDFSPGYEINNARFDRLLPDRCVSCHASYPKTIPYLEGKYAELRPGIGCERCHGPGALHVAERRAGAKRDSSYDNTIVNPARMPLERRLDACEQCHVHTAVAVLRNRQGQLQLHAVAAAARSVGALQGCWQHRRRVACGPTAAEQVLSRVTHTSKPLECATCHNPHRPPVQGSARNQTCESCHQTAALEKKLASSSSLKDHARGANCVSCHMPKIQERTVPHWDVHRALDSRAWASTGATRRTRQRFMAIEPFFQRDRSGPEAAVYKGMGEIVYASLANNSRVLADGAPRCTRTRQRHHPADARFMLGAAYQQLGSTDEAIRALGSSAARTPINPKRDVRSRRSTSVRDGRRLRSSINTNVALACSQRSRGSGAEYADYLQRRESERGEGSYRRALAEQPSLSTAWFNLWHRARGKGKLKESSDAFQEAVHLDPALAQGTHVVLEIRTRGNVRHERAVARFAVGSAACARSRATRRTDEATSDDAPACSSSICLGRESCRSQDGWNAPFATFPWTRRERCSGISASMTSIRSRWTLSSASAG